MNGLNLFGGKQLLIIVNTRKKLHRIEKHCGAWPQQIRGLSSDNAPVAQFHCGCGVSGFTRALKRGSNNRAICTGQVHCGHQASRTLRLYGRKILARFQSQSLVPAANNLLLRGLAADLVIADAKSRHVDAHVSGRLVGRGPHDLLEQATKDGEGLDITVVVDRRFPVSLQVEVVNHVDVIQVNSGCFVGDVYGVV